MSAAHSALSVVLFGLAALMALGAASMWARLAKRLEDRPATSLVPAAGVTAAAFLFLGLALAWSALVALPN